LLAKFLKSKRFHKCSKIIHEGSPTKRCGNEMKDCLKQSKESSKSKLNLKSTKESEQKTNKSMGCSTYKSPIVFKEVGVGAKGVRVSAKLATPHHILRQNFV
jgi:hypothetical protein